MCENSIREKIRKTLELANRAGTPEEAAVAFSKAQEMMLKYSVSEADLTEENKAKIVSKIYKPEMSKVSFELKQMAITLANHFPVEIYFTHDHKGKHLAAFGLEYHVESFIQFLSSVQESYISLKYTEFYKPGGLKEQGLHMAQFRRGFSLGFCQGLDKSLSINETEKGLIVLTGEDVVEEFQRMTTGKTERVNFASGDHGFEAGLKGGMSVGAGRNKRRIES